MPRPVVADVFGGAHVLPAPRVSGRSPRSRERPLPRGPCKVGGTPAAVPNASRAIAPAPRPSASPASIPDGSAAPSTTAQAIARGTSHVASTRTVRTSSGPTTTITAVAPASLTSGTPARQQMRLEGEPVGLDDATQTMAAPTTPAAATSRSRTRLPSPAQQDVDNQHDASASTPKNASARARPPSRTRSSEACATSRSCPGADAAMTADSPMTIAATNKKTESIVLRLRRPGSVSVRSATRQERPCGAGGPSRLVPCRSRQDGTGLVSSRSSPQSERTYSPHGDFEHEGRGTNPRLIRPSVRSRRGAPAARPQPPRGVSGR